MNSKGLISMTCPRNLSRFAHHLVTAYAKFNSSSDQYELLVSDIPEWDLHKFSTIFMSDEDLSSEATSLDNEHYMKTMLPALIRYMKNITDKSEEFEFMNAWLTGVTKYFERAMQELIDDACSQWTQAISRGECA